MSPIAFILILLYLLSGGYHQVTLGRGENCEGFNICSIVDVSNPRQKNSMLALIGLSKEGRPEFLFKKSSISDHSFVTYFSTGYFVLDADFLIPKDIQPYFGNRFQSLASGRYRITEHADFYAVTF